MKTLNRINIILRKIEIHLAATLVGMIFILTTLNIILRYFFNNPIRWTEEVVCYGFVWLGFMAVCYTLSMDSHVRFSLVLDKLTKKARAWFNFAFDLMIAAAIVIMFPSVIRCFDFMVPTPSLEIWQGYFFLIVPICYALIIFHTLMNAISRFKPGSIDMVALYAEEDAGYAEKLAAEEEV